MPPSRSEVRQNVSAQVRVLRRRILELGGGRSASALIIQTHLREAAAATGPDRLTDLSDPIGYVSRLRDFLEPARLSVRTVRTEPIAENAASRQLDMWLRIASERLPPFSLGLAVRLARAADQLCSNRDSLFSADVADHFLRSSSFGAKGRMLASLVRYKRPEKALELGTAYGMSAMCLLSELAPIGGTLDTIEMHPTVFALSDALLRTEYADSVHTHLGSSAEILPGLQGPFDLVFHDAAHSEAAYIADFAALEPSLAPGAVVLLDDIRWEPLYGEAPARTYQGWMTLTQHPRVRRAFEIDKSIGLLELR